MGFGDILQQEGNFKVNVNGAYGDLTTDPETGQYTVDVNTTGHPVYGQPVQQAALLSSSIAGIPVMWIVIALFAIAGLAVARRV